MLTAEMIGKRAVDTRTTREIVALYRRLEADDYTRTLTRFCTAGLERYGAEWQYCDLPCALVAAAELVQPAAYLEIGVRRGRSVAAVVSAHPSCDVVGFDTWKPNYAGMETPGPDFVRKELLGLGHTGRVDLIAGDSHQTLPAYFEAHADRWFDLIAVDGDHTAEGAAADLADVLPRLRVGGVLVFDDISHPAHPELLGVWREMTGDARRFSVWEYTALGYGVAIAVRKT